MMKHAQLSYIFFLHQTTTHHIWGNWSRCWVISSFYIKPQLCNVINKQHNRWVISSFYIKPQPCIVAGCTPTVELYLLSTSNHNTMRAFPPSRFVELYLLSTSNHNGESSRPLTAKVELYLLSTSNHNNVDVDNISFDVELYLLSSALALQSWVISSFYIKPQPAHSF